MSNYSSSQFSTNPNTPWAKVIKLIPRASKVLDVGCSSGNFGEILITESDCTVDGLELDKEDFLKAKKKLRKVFNLNIETDDLFELDTDYDVIYFGDVIEHLVFPAKALQRAKALLAPKGSIIFSLPNMSHISVRLMLLGGNFTYGNTGLLDKTHLHFYDKKEVERVFSDAGLELETLDWVERDIPQDMLTKQLKELGLTPSQKFFELSKGLDAAAYQYVGRALPSLKTGTVKHRTPTVSPAINHFENYLAEVKKEYAVEIDKARAHARNVTAEADHRLNEAVQNYESSLSWKITKPLRKASAIARKRTK